MVGNDFERGHIVLKTQNGCVRKLVETNEQKDRNDRYHAVLGVVVIL